MIKAKLHSAVVVLLYLTGAAAAQTLPQPQPQSKAEESKVWSAIAQKPDLWQGSWESVAPIADDYPTPPHYTAWARDYIAHYKPSTNGKDSPFASCKPLGVPFVMNIGGMPMKFFQSPGMIAIYIESSGAIRFIHTDGRAHDPHVNPSFMGESISHWEGDTLVIDTIGLNSDTLLQIGKSSNRKLFEGDPSPMAGVIFAPHGPKLHVIERIRLIDFNTLELQVTLDDPKIFETPYTLPPRKFIRTIEKRNEPQEWLCTDNVDLGPGASDPGAPDAGAADPSQPDTAPGPK